MDWNQTKNVAEADLDTIVGKVSKPKAALTALRKKITAEVAKVEARMLELDERVTQLPDMLEQHDRMLMKVDAIITKAKGEGRADLARVAAARRDKHLAERAQLEAELEGIDQEQMDASEWIDKLHDKLAEVKARIETMGSEAQYRSDPEGSPRLPAADQGRPQGPAATRGSDLPANEPAPAQAPAPAKPDSLDDEFAALLGDMDIDLDSIELPKKTAALPDPDDGDDLGIPELVTVSEDELPEDEELPPLKEPKPKGKTAKSKAPAGPIAPTKPAPVSAGKAEQPTKKKSRTWLWITSAVVVVGGGGVAVAHFVLHLF